MVSIDGHYAQRIADGNTLKVLVEEGLEHVKNVQMVSNWTLRTPPVSLAATPHNSDENMLYKVQRFGVLQDNIVEEVFYMGAFINPSMFQAHNGTFYIVGSHYLGKNDPERAIQVYRIDYPITKVGYNLTCEDPLPFGGYKCLSSSFVNTSLPAGQDPRATVHHNRIIVSFSNFYSYYLLEHLRMAAFDLVQVKNGSWVQNGELTYAMMPPTNIVADEKNWVPFTYQEHMYYIQQINPLVVVTADTGNVTHVRGNLLMGTKIVSSFPQVDLPWKYGHIRGGTNAIYIHNHHDSNASFYLAFFHTSTKLPGNPYRTYFMGAFIFSAQPPFHILAITRYPIIPFPEMYEGRWKCYTRHCGIDYVIFPMSVQMYEDHLLVAMGRQDAEGWLLKISLAKLLENMETVHSYNNNWAHYNQHHRKQHMNHYRHHQHRARGSTETSRD